MMRFFVFLAIVALTSSCIGYNPIISEYKKIVEEGDYSKLESQRLFLYANNNKKEIIERFDKDCNAYKNGQSTGELFTKRTKKILNEPLKQSREKSAEDLIRHNSGTKKAKDERSLLLLSASIENKVLKRQCSF